ncbi:MAG TPA: SprT family zinc-dependent metalloprotease [Candidatus Dormibacteraeota bacterium]|nr:SprT family zinc-dependent metalloprotease [Candidatus Dormibacteraeota bacterium]
MPPELPTTHLARLPGGPVPYTLRRSARSRGIRVTLDPHRGVLATVPPATRRGFARPEQLVEAFLSERERWLRRHLERQARERARLETNGPLGDGATVRYRGEPHRLVVTLVARGRSSVERVGGPDGDELHIRLASRDAASLARVLRGWARDRAVEAVDDAIALHAPALGVRPSAVALRDPRSRWGSASRKGRLMLSWRLVLAPPEALETVVVHELAHLRVFGHGPRFWDMVASRRPDHAAWRRWLRRHSLELHAAFVDPDED